jgi:hypothetical protein
VEKASEKTLGELLVGMGFVTHEQCGAALEHGKANGLRIGESLVALGHITPGQLSFALGEQFGQRTLELQPEMVDAELVSRFPMELLQRHQMMPLVTDGSALVVAVSDPGDTDGLRALLDSARGYTVIPRIGDPLQIGRCLEHAAHLAARGPLPELVAAETQDAAAASSSGAGVLQYAVIAALQEPRCDLEIRCQGAEAWVSRKEASPWKAGAGDRLESFSAHAFPTVRDNLLAQCRTLSPVRMPVHMWRHPLQFAGRHYALQVAVLQDMAGSTIRLRALEIREPSGAPPCPEAAAFFSSAGPPPLTVVLYEDIGRAEDWLCRQLEALPEAMSAVAVIECMRCLPPRAACYPGRFTDAPGAVAAQGAAVAVFDYPVGADTVRRVRFSTGCLPVVIAIAPVNEGTPGAEAPPETLELIREMEPPVLLLRSSGEVVHMSALAALERFAGEAE